MTNNNELKVVEKYRKQGYNYLRGGSPDFVFFKVVDNKIIKDSIIFVEVKTQQDGLRYEQQIYKEILDLLGCEYKLEVV